LKRDKGAVKTSRSPSPGSSDEDPPLNSRAKTGGAEGGLDAAGGASGLPEDQRPFSSVELARLRLDLETRLVAEEVERRLTVLVEERVSAALASESVQRELTGRLERERRALEAAVEVELAAERARAEQDAATACAAIAAKEVEFEELETARRAAEGQAVRDREEAEARAMEQRLTELQARQAAARKDAQRKKLEDEKKKKEQALILGKGRTKLSFGFGR